MPDGNRAPQIGDNRGPPFDADQVEKLTGKAAQFVEAAGKWLDLEGIKTEDDAARLNDFIAGVKKRRKAVDEARVDAKRPHDDAGKAVQAAFKPILDQLDRAAQKVQPMLTAFLQEQERQRKEEARRHAEEARKAQEEAERRAAQAASRNDIAGETEAEAARERADRQAKDAARAEAQRTNVRSATGGGRTATLRTYYRAEVTNTRVAFMHFDGHPDLIACLKNLAEREARSKNFNPETDKVPGCAIHVERKAV